jgi:hypothetical protein
VLKFDGKYLNDDMFERKVFSKVAIDRIPAGEDEQGIVEVFAIENGSTLDRCLARNLNPRHSLDDLSDVVVKVEPGESNMEVTVKMEPGSMGSAIVDLSDVVVKVEPGEKVGFGYVECNEVQYVGSSSVGLHTSDAAKNRRNMMKGLLHDKMALEKSLARMPARTSLKNILDEKLAKEISLSRQNEWEKYYKGLSPSEITEMMTWDEDTPSSKCSNDAHEGDPGVFCTPTKTTQGPKEFCTPTKRLSFTTGSMSPITSKNWKDADQDAGKGDNDEIDDEVRPQMRAELLVKKKKQMAQKTKWAVNNALKQSRTM